MRRSWALVVLALCALVLTSACPSLNTSGSSSGTTTAGGQKVPSGCTAVDVASRPRRSTCSPTWPATSTSRSRRSRVRCVGRARPAEVLGRGEQLLADGWPDSDVNGPQPVIWSPAASAWGAVLNDARTSKGQPPSRRPTPSRSCARRCVIAMPRPMAQALGWPSTPIGYHRPPGAGPEPARVGEQGPSRVGPVQARQDQPQLLDQRARRDDRPVLRGDAEDDAV